MRGGILGAAAAGFLLAAGTLAPAGAEPFLDLFAGKSFALNSDLDLKQPRSGSDFTIEDVSFDDQSFKSPPWYGLRAGYFFEKHPWLGTALEFFHFKIFAETEESKRFRGTRDGAAVDTLARIDSVVQRFEVSHGVNYLTLDALVRYSLFEDPERFRHGRVQLYGGLGVGPVITHTESRIDNVRSDRGYEIAGAGVQAFAGLRALLFKYVGLFAEYKFTHSRLDVGVASGDARLDENTHHLIGGVTIYLPSF